jgi:gliding motility-associated-like protein
LAARAIDREGNEVELRWTEPAGQGTGWTYRLILLDAEGREISNRPLTGSAFTFLDAQTPADRQILRYRVAAISGTGRTVYSNVAVVTRRLVVVVPTAFTPNGDGRNDVLEVKGRFIRTFSFVILDRNGVQVFRTTDRTQRWDGRVNGTLAAPQVFTYRFEATDEAGQRVAQSGTVTLLR